MRKILFCVAAMVALWAIALVQPANAQVFGEFDTVRVVTGGYQEIDVFNDPQVHIIPPTQFGLPPNFDVPNPNDGYARVDLGFQFEFNGEIYDKVWVNVNGFVTFGRKDGNTILLPPNTIPNDPRALFNSDVTSPVNVLAPFWGDHYYRWEADVTNRFLMSYIAYKRTDSSVIIQWKDLNINYNMNGTILKNSVANFQVIIYKSKDPISKQGSIDFTYGPVGGNNTLASNEDKTILTRGSSIGLKGEGKEIGQQAEFINALINDVFIENNPGSSYIDASHREDLSNLWPPTGRMDARFRFGAKAVLNVEEWWGDGDADMSKAAGQRHYGMEQARFVTVNDSRIIMRSIARHEPLDSIRRRPAYHADVNHNGRYYRTLAGTKVSITKKSMNFFEDLPTDVSSTKQILFEANEYDAALILAYTSARVPELPWLLDTIVHYGKVSVDFAGKHTLTFDNPAALGTGSYRMPIYSENGFDGALGVKFDINGSVIGIDANTKDGNTVLTSYEGSTAVVSALGKFEANEPIAWVVFTTNENNLNINDIRINDEVYNNRNLVLSANDAAANVVVSMNPNPVISNANFTINVPVSGFYTLAIYDMFGNRVATLASENMEMGVKNINWNARNEAGANLANGMYLYKLEGAASATGTFVITK
ncbi:MAG: FlgD immunoglobulin-like domain containing protein [Chloroflexota bacterium]